MGGQSVHTVGVRAGIAEVHRRLFLPDLTRLLHGKVLQDSRNGNETFTDYALHGLESLASDDIFLCVGLVKLMPCFRNVM